MIWQNRILNSKMAEYATELADFFPDQKGGASALAVALKIL